MMTDKLLRFSEKQTLASGSVSDNTLRVGKGDIAIGNNMSIYVITDEAPATAMTVALETSDLEDMSDAVTIAEYKASADAVEGGGIVVNSRLPAGCKTYLRLKYSGPASGTVSAGLAKDVG